MAVIQETIGKLNKKLADTEDTFNEAQALVDEATVNLAAEKERSKPLEDAYLVIKEKFETNKKDLIDHQVCPSAFTHFPC